jgi:hypothetical protein
MSCLRSGPRSRGWMILAGSHASAAPQPPCGKVDPRGAVRRRGRGRFPSCLRRGPRATSTGSGSRGSEWRGGGDDVGGGAVEAKGGGEAVEAARSFAAGDGQRGRERGTSGGRGLGGRAMEGMECGRRRRTMRYGRSRSMDGRTAERGRQTTIAYLISSRDFCWTSAVFLILSLAQDEILVAR